MAKHKNVFFFLVSIVAKVLFICVVIGSAVALILSCASTFIHPQSSSLIALLGIGCQILILLNIIICALLAMGKKMLAIIPAIALLCSVAFWGDFYQIPIFKNSKESNESEKQINELKLVSYNVHNMRSPRNYERTIDSVVLFMRMSRADIICLQEFGSLTENEKAMIDRNLAHFTYRKLTHDQAIFSRYKISNYRKIKFDNNFLPAVRATIDFNDKRFALYNLHMQTTEFNSMVPEGLGAFMGSGQFTKDAHSTAKVVQENSVRRANQAILIDSLIKLDGLPTIITGDFNDTPASYVYSLLSENRSDAFRSEGEDYVYSYRKLRRLFRIDYILVPDEYEIKSYTSPNLRWSDHNPVIANILIH